MLRNILLTGTGIISSLLGCNIGGDQERAPVPIRQNQLVNEETLGKDDKENLTNLTSPNFFEYTQAARHWLDKGRESVPLLAQNRHLLREVHGTVMPVCCLIIALIFEKEPQEWVTAQLNNPVPEVKQLAAAELERRLQQKK